jgi:hypothetical protein
MNVIGTTEKNSAIKRFSKKPFCKPEYMMVVPLETLLPNWVLALALLRAGLFSRI